MGTKISTLFLFAVLVLGMTAYPASINPTSLDSSSNLSFLTAFAEEDDEERDDEDETDDQEKDDDDEKDDGDELENDEEKDEDETDDQEKDDDDEKDDGNELENDEEKDEDETDDQERDDTRDEDEEELEIEVEVKNDKAKIKIELNDNDYRFVLTDDVSESAIITAIMDNTGLTENEITSNWEFEIEDEEREDEDDEDSENDHDSKIKDTAKTEKLLKHENKAQENAEETILELQQKIDQLEDRLQKLLDKFETGEYFGTVTTPDPVPDSFVITIDGFASSLDDDTVVSNMEGEIFLESLMTASESTKLRITGGEILVGDTFYDFVIGKARLSSSGTSGDKDSMIILGQIMDDQGNVNTIRLSLDGTTSLDDFGSESIDFEINSSRSKIASQWGFDGVGLLSTL